MNCHTFEDIRTELARDRTSDQLVEASLRASALAHLDECPTCALRLQDDRTLTHRLDELAREMKSLTAPPSVEESLRRAFRHELSGPELSPVLAIEGGRNRSARNNWSLSIAAVLVVVLILLGIAGLRYRAGRYPQPGPLDSPVAESSPTESPSNVKTEAISLLPKPGKQFSGTRGRRKPDLRARYSYNRGSSGGQTTANTASTTASVTESEVATHFMPLGYAGPINLQDGGQLVRIEMSRAAMLSLGLPVNMDRYSESVKADVFLGADGFARAIRFVQ